VYTKAIWAICGSLEATHRLMAHTITEGNRTTLLRSVVLR